MKSFIVDDYTEKLKGYKARREDSERRHMAAPLILDQASVSLRPPKGYYGNFGENDNEYVDQDDFSSENGNKNATVISIDDDKMSLGDTMLCNNINKQIEFLQEDDIELDQFEKMPPIWIPKTHGKPKGRGRGRGRGARVPKGAGHERGRGTQMPKEENEVGGKNLTHNKMDNEKELGMDGISIKQHDEQTPDTTEYFNNGTFLNTELSHAGSSLSIEVIADVHKENVSCMDEGNTNESHMDEGNSNDAIILHYNYNLYLVNPPLKPQQPVLLVNEGGSLNGVFLNDKGTSGNVIYEVVDSHNKSRPRDPNELFKCILSSDSDDPATKSADDLRTVEKGAVLTKPQGHQTDSKFERLQVIAYYDEPPKKINAMSTEMKPQQSVTKVDQSATKAEQSVTKKVDQSAMKAEQSAKDIAAKSSIRLYFCSICTATFWTDGGLRHHESLHFRKSAFDPDYHTQELEKKHQETEDHNEAMNDESPQPNGDETEEKDDKSNEKDSKDIRNGEKTEESVEKEKQKGDEATEKDKDITEYRNEATNDESPQPNGDETEEKDDKPNEKDSKDIRNGEKTEESVEKEKQKGDEATEKDKDITEYHNEAMNDESPQPNGDETEEKDDKPNEKDSKDIRNGEKTEESVEKEKQKGDEATEKDKDITEYRNEAMNDESPQPNGDETEEKDDKPNEKDSKDIRNGEKTEESVEEEKQKGGE